MPGNHKNAPGRIDSTQVVGFRLGTALAREVKAEAGRRGLRLNQLFAEMWSLYKQQRPRPGT